jgi:WD40 repeat protein
MRRPSLHPAPPPVPSRPGPSRPVPSRPGPSRPGRARPAAAALLVLVGLGGAGVGCTAAPPIDEGTIAALKEREGAFLTGAPKGLGAPQVLNRRDFIYALAFGKDDVVAFVHHVTTHMELTAARIEPLRPRFQQPVNPTEFDVEDVVILDAGEAAGTIALPSRQGIARSFDAATGALKRELISGVALVRIAASADGGLLALGSADGRVLLLDAATFAVRGQARLHEDEVRGLSFLPDGRLVSASFDGTVKVSSLVPGADPVVHAAATALKSGERLFLSHLDGARAVATVRDGRQPSNAVTTAAVKRLGLAPAEGDGTLPVVTAAGAADAPAVALGRVQIQTLDLGPLAAAVCDACVPPGAELVLGAPALARASFVDDIARDEVVVKPREGEEAATLVALALSPRIEKSIALPGPATDLDVSRGGAVLVSFSHARAERSFDLYEAEKKGSYPAVSEKSGAALLDLEAGTLTRTFVGHRGFTTTAALSPDGRTVATGGWDKRVLLWDARTGDRVTEREVAWLVRRVRFSVDGHLLGVAAWTPVNALNEGDSEPSLLLYPLALEETRVAGR